MKKAMFRTSDKARNAANNGSRPWDMWTRYTVLVQVKRQCPELFGAAKALSDNDLLGTISPCVDRVHTWCDGRKAHYKFCAWRLMAKLGMDAEAKAWRIARNGKDWER